MEFQTFGLTYYESKAMESLLKGPLTVRQLCKSSRIPLGKVYSILKSLERKNIIKQTDSRPKLSYIENVSDVMDLLIKQKQKEDEKLFANMRQISVESDALQSKQSKFFQIGTTIKENKEIQMRTFLEAEKEVLQIFNKHHKPAQNRKSKLDYEKEISNATKRGVIFKAIYPVKTKLPDILKKINPQKFNVKYKDIDFMRCDIIDGKKVLVKLTHDDPLSFGGVIFLENEKLARNLTNIFNQIWKDA